MGWPVTVLYEHIGSRRCGELPTRTYTSIETRKKERKKERKLQEPISLIFTSTYVIHRSHRWLQRWKSMSNCNVMCEYRRYKYSYDTMNDTTTNPYIYGCPFLLPCSPHSKKPGTRSTKKKKGRKKQKKKQNHNQHSLPSLPSSPYRFDRYRALVCLSVCLSNPQQLIMQVLTNQNPSTTNKIK